MERLIFIPSTAADIIPPAYPAPSPQGYMPSIFDKNEEFLMIFTGEELRVSTPVRIASGLANPDNFLSKYKIPSFSVEDTKDGNISFKLDKVVPGKYEGTILPILEDALFCKKSSILWIGAL